ncbi:MAG: hypothetical protein EXS30_04400 [Pedosphaera sp.]|nr:hypothetical protein [Pedosphaera sp.]
MFSFPRNLCYKPFAPDGPYDEWKRKKADITDRRQVAATARCRAFPLLACWIYFGSRAKGLRQLPQT